MMATASVGAAVQDLKRRVAAVAVALVSRDGQVLYADLPTEAYADTFAVMCATILGAAVTANAELGHRLPGRVVVDGHDVRSVLVPCGRSALLVAVVRSDGAPEDLVTQVERFADLLSFQR